MRKLIALCFVLFIVLFAFDTYAITIPPQFNDEITGPSTVCTGTVGNYTLVMENCFVSILDIQTTSNGILTTLPSFPTDLNQFSVQWFNNGSTTTTGRIDVVVWFYPGQCPNPAGPIPPASTKTVSLTVTIEPGNPTVPIPNTISGSFNYEGNLAQGIGFYDFSTSSSDAPEGFDWTVSGGSIYRNNGSSITVEANNGSCQLRVGVRGKKRNCQGGIVRSPERSSTYNINVPANPSNINGPARLTSGQGDLYTVNEVAGAESYVWRIESDANNASDWEISPIMVFGIPWLPTGRNAPVIFNGCCFSDATLYVRAKNSCGESIAEASIFIESRPRLILPSFSSTISPNPVASGQPVLINTLNKSTDQVDLVIIKNETGELIYSYDDLSGEQSEIVISGLKKGSYFVQFRSNEDVRTERLIVLD